MVAHSLWERGAVGSNPATPTEIGLDLARRGQGVGVCRCALRRLRPLGETGDAARDDLRRYLVDAPGGHPAVRRGCCCRQVRSCRCPGKASEAHTGSPSGRMMAWMLAPFAVAGLVVRTSYRRAPRPCSQGLRSRPDPCLYT